MLAHKFISLNRKLVVSVIIVSIGFAIIAAAIFYMTELERSRQKTQVMINQLLDTVEYSSAIAAYTNNEQIAKDVAQGLLRNDIVQEVNISSDQGLRLIRTKEPIAGVSQKISRPLLSPFDNQQIIGTINVVPRSDYNLVEAAHSALLSAINSFLLIALTTIIILWVFRRNILQPLTIVSNTLHAIMEGKKQRITPLEKHHNDELGRFIVDINKLLDVLDIKFKDEHALRQEIELFEKQLRNIFETTSAGLFQIDQNGKILTYNPTFFKFLVNDRLPQYDLIGCDFAETFIDDNKLFKSMIYAAMSSKSLISNDLALKANQQNDKTHWIHCLLSRIDDVDGQIVLEGVVFDISARVEKEKAIRYQAEYDSLTGLLRRDSIERQLAIYLEDTNQLPLILMLLDLDGFKAVNDTFGHDAGDEVLIEVTQRFKKNVRVTDVVGRMGGDEFMIVLNKCEPINAELTIAKKIISAIQEPIILKSKQTVNIGVSIGMASVSSSYSTVDALIKAADDAMYKVKRHGKNGFAIHKNDERVFVELSKDFALAAKREIE